MTPGIPVDILEKRAADQRRGLHNSVAELRATVKERLDFRKAVRNHFWPAAGTLAVTGLVLGYTATGLFTRR